MKRRLPGHVWSNKRRMCARGPTGPIGILRWQLPGDRAGLQVRPCGSHIPGMQRKYTLPPHGGLALLLRLLPWWRLGECTAAAVWVRNLEVFASWCTGTGSWPFWSWHVRETVITWLISYGALAVWAKASFIRSWGCLFPRNGSCSRFCQRNDFSISCQ